MYCGYCGCPLKGKEKFCPRCGRELPRHKQRSKRIIQGGKAPVIAAVVLLAAAGAGFLSWKFLWGEPAGYKEKRQSGMSSVWRSISRWMKLSRPIWKVKKVLSMTKRS